MSTSTEPKSAKPPLRAVIDTNVVLSGITHRGLPYQILAAGHASLFRWVFSREIIDEYLTVARRHGVAEQASYLVSAIRNTGLEVQVPSFLPDTFTDIVDDSDRVIFAAAHIANACFVTGNHRHFPWPSYCGVGIFTPRQFYEML